MAKHPIAIAVAMACAAVGGASEEPVRRIALVHPEAKAYEASALAPAHDAVRARFGFDEAYWTVSDEAAVHQALMLVGMKRDTATGAEKWSLEIVPEVRAAKPDAGTDDAESLFRDGDRLWIVGSVYGSKKKGLLEAKRHFVVALDETAWTFAVDPLGPQLHERINGWLRAGNGPPLIERRAAGEEKLVAATVAAFAQKPPKGGHPVVAVDDRALNVEGAVALADGTLALGLRFPVTADGNPVVVLADRADPAAHRFLVLDIGTPAVPCAVRDLTLGPDGAVYALVGSMDSDPENSPILAGYPDLGAAKNSLVKFRVPPRDSASGETVRVETETVRAFRFHDALEGVVFRPDGKPLFVEDAKDCVALWVGE